MKTKIINKTPHDINIVDWNGVIIKVYPSESSGSLIRLNAKTKIVGLLPDGTRLSKTVFGDPEGLPEFKEGTFYIVSQLVKSALPERTDLLVPAEMIRDAEGKIIGCKSLGV